MVTSPVFDPVSLKTDFVPIDRRLDGFVLTIPTLALVTKAVNALVNCKVFEVVFPKLVTSDSRT